MGITVDDKTINIFCDALTNGSLGRQDIVKILITFAREYRRPTFLSILREELLALRYRQLFHKLRSTILWVGDRQRRTNAGRLSSG